MTYVSRDPFARSELHKQIATVGHGSCDWCGQVRMSKHKAPVPQLYTFLTESDGGTTSRHRGLFCSKSCHDSYHS
jgi:hypothetical protein